MCVPYRYVLVSLLVVPCLVGCSDTLRFRLFAERESTPSDTSTTYATRTLDSEFEALLVRVERNFNRFQAECLSLGGDVEAAAALLKAVQIEIGQFRQADDSVRGLIDLWSYMRRLNDSLSNGADRERFGAVQTRAIRVADRSRQAVVDLAAQVLDAEQFHDILAQIDEHARKNPLDSVVSQPDAAAFSTFDVGSNLLGQLVSLPNEAFDRLNPTSGLSKAGNRFADVAEQLPTKTRLEIEELLEEMHEFPVVIKLFETLERLNNQVTELQQTMTALPPQIGNETRTVLDALGQQQPALQETLAATESTIDSANQTLQSAQVTSQSLRELSESLEAVLLATDQLTSRFRSEERETGDVANDEEPFDILEYQQTAESLTKTAAELRGLLADVESLLIQAQAPETEARLQQQVDGVLAQTDHKLRGVVDHIAWRLAQLCGLVFVLFVAYRPLAWLFSKKPQEPTKS